MRVFTDLQHLPDFRQTVITIGSFDGVHQGHQLILERVRNLAASAGVESVVITFDPHPRTVLRPNDAFQLITNTREKTALLLQSGIDNIVVVPFTTDFASLSARAYVEDFLIRYFQPTVVVIGYDHHFGHDREGDIHFLKQYSSVFSVSEIPVYEVDDLAVSSSKVRKALDQADIQSANRLLGHPFVLTGEVVTGNQIGRTIGFPTANLSLNDPYKLIPPNGIYAARAGLSEGPKWDAMLYIGDRPTLEGQNERRIEVSLLDFEGDLYGKMLWVDVLDHIRPDKKLDSLEALQAQIAADKMQIVASLQQLDTPMPTETMEGAAENLNQAAAKVAVVILNYNTRHHLQQYLPSVVAHSGDAHIIVADNGSPDDSIEWLQQTYPQIEIVDLVQNWGFAEGYNKALEIVQHTHQGVWDYYILLNSDVEVTAGWIEPIITAMEANRSIAIAQPKILSDIPRDRFEHAGAAGGWIDTLGYPFCRGRIFTEVEIDRGQYNEAQSCFWASGAAFFVRAELYHAFGGFDADYFAHNEEIDLCWRMKRAGYEVWCFPSSTVHHLGGGTLGYESPRKVYLNFRNSLFSLIKNESAQTLYWLIPARLLLDGVAALMYASKGQWASIRAILNAHGAFYRAFGATLRKRKKVHLLVEQNRVRASTRQTGTYSGSVVWSHYIRRIKQFTLLRK